MAKRKRYPKLPNGYGSIKYLGKKRRNAYGVYPPVTDYTDDGVPITPKALCYTDAWIKGFTILTAYKSGTYVPGMELGLNFAEEDNVDTLMQKILADYNQIRRKELNTPVEKTFEEIYKEFYFDKYERDGSRKFSASTINSTKTAYKHCSALYHRSFRSLRHQDLQTVIDSCALKHASLELILNLIKQMYAYAEKNDLCDKNYSNHLKINRPDDDESGQPFSEEELKILWNNKTDPYIELVLIMCYSGFRISECRIVAVDLKEKYFKGGIKTEAGRERLIPIHSAILQLVEKRIARDRILLNITTSAFRRSLAKRMRKLNMEHTPHDCRHTFSYLCEKYNVKENDRKRMMGHSFGSDITNAIYGHRSIKELRIEIEKIEVCY